MEFHLRTAPSSRRENPPKLGILAAGFNPPTVAHGELIRTAGSHVDEVLCVLPREFPHKKYHGASLEQRIAMLAASFPSCSIGVSDGGLFIEIARECRAHYDDETRLYFVCGRDAAERIVTWDYGRPDAIQEILGEFELLVSPRGGHYE